MKYRKYNMLFLIFIIVIIGYVMNVEKLKICWKILDNCWILLKYCWKIINSVENIVENLFSTVEVCWNVENYLVYFTGRQLYLYHVQYLYSTICIIFIFVILFV